MAGSGPSYDSVPLEASEDLARYNKWVVSSIADSIRGRTLEFGAGIGTMSALVRPLASELVLVEPADNLANALTTRFIDDSAVTVCRGLLADAVTGNSEEFDAGFDTIVSFNVLEHVADDVGLLRLAHGLLRPGGRLCAFVPAGPGIYGTMDAQVDHQRRYTKATLDASLRGAGLTPIRVQYFDLFGIVPWFFVGRVLKRTTTGAGAGWYDRLVIPPCKVVDRLTGPPRGKNLVAVAEAVS